MQFRSAHRAVTPATLPRRGAPRRSRFAPASLLLLAGLLPTTSAGGALEDRGAEIYQRLCTDCHGAHGEGVAGKHDEPLYGTRSIEALARLIDRTMPEGAPEQCVGDDARAVAAYVHAAFYSPEARARNRPPRIDLARLTNRQYRESVADLVGSFQPPKPATTSAGLRAEYFQSQGMNKKEKRAFSRTDAAVNFDFGPASPGEGITPDQFSIAWEGSLLAPDTGEYELRLRTPNGARLYINADLRAGDANLRDDSDARRHSASIDLWVSSGGRMREETTRLFLLGGRRYPLRLDFFKYKETNAAVHLEWRPPHGVWSVIGGPSLSPDSSPTVAVITTPFPPDDRSLGYERGSAVSKAWHDATTQAAIEAASQVAARLNALSGVPEKAPDRADRLQGFAATFAARAFRRPLTDDLRQLYVQQPFAGATDPETAVKRAVLLALKSPRFLYPELGEPVDDYTVAARLALSLWDSLPDPALLAVAESGGLRRPEQIRTHARRLAEDPRARAKLRGFFHHWLAMDEAADLTKDPAAYPGFDAALRADLRESLDRFIEHVVWSESADYRQLLLADYLFLNPRLAQYYGAEPPAEPTFQPVAFDPEVRAGILTHPYLLATFAYHKSSSPIHRGVFLTRNILGRFLRPPPMAIEFMDDRFDPSLTMREKVTELTRSETCMGCHVTINPLGFSLEHYDAVGRFRTLDNHKPVNAESEYTTTQGEVVRLRGPRDLAQHAAASEEARLGFVRQLFQHTVKQTPAAYGADTLQQCDAVFTRSSFHVRELLVEIATLAALHNHDPSLLARQ